MENPVEKVLNEKQMTITQLAILSGVQRAWVAQLIRGDAVKLSGRVLDALESLGYQRNELTQQYSEWREELSNKIKLSCMA